MWKSVLLLLLPQSGMVRSNIFSHYMIAATYLSQSRVSSPQLNNELADLKLSFNRMIESIPVPPVFEFNHTLNNIAKMEQYPTAISLILHHDFLSSNSLVKPNLYTFSIAMNCFCHMNRVAFGFSVYGKLFKFGYRPDCAVINTLIRGLCDIGCISETAKFAVEFVNNGLQPTVVTIGTVLNGYCKRGSSLDALLFYQYVDKNMSCQPGTYEYNIIINGLFKDGHVTQAHEISLEMINKGILPDDFTSNTWIKGFGKCQELDILLVKMDDLREKKKAKRITGDVVMCSILVDNLCKKGKIEEAHDVVKSMLESGIKPDTFTFTSLIHGYCLLRKVNHARKLLTTMIAQGCVPNEHTYTTLIDGYCLIGKMDNAREMFEVMIQEGYAPCVVSYSALINGYCKSKKMEHIEKAKDLINQMYRKGIFPNIVTYTSLIEGLCHVGRLKDAFFLFEDIQNRGFYPNLKTYSTLINSLIKNDKLGEAIELYREMEGNGIVPDIVVCTSLIDGMCKSGNIKDGATLFQRLLDKGLQPNCRTYNVMIGGFFRFGYIKDVIDLLRKMEVEGCKMDGKNYNLVIQEFVQHKDTKLALFYLGKMREDGFYPKPGTSTALFHLLVTKDLDDKSKKELKEFFGKWNRKVRCDGKGTRFRSKRDFVAKGYGIKLRKDPFNPRTSQVNASCLSI